MSKDMSIDTYPYLYVGRTADYPCRKTGRYYLRKRGDSCILNRSCKFVEIEDIGGKVWFAEAERVVIIRTERP